MIFYLHYILLTSGLSGTSVLLGVFIKAYSDASQAEIGVLLMTLPFLTILIRLIFCSMADRHQAYRLYLVASLCVMLVGFSTVGAVPFFPDFYTKHPRIAWYFLVLACYVGNGGLAVAWSLGESLAMNKAQKTKTPYARMRLMGTVSWGVYGYIIGQINEVPFLPKYVPAFIILAVSVVLEIILVVLWDKEDFVMFDGQTEELKREAEQQQQLQDLQHLHDKSRLSTLKRSDILQAQEQQQQVQTMENTQTPYGSYVAGSTLSLSSATGKVVRDLLVAEEELNRKLNYSQGSLNKATGRILLAKADSVEPHSQALASTLSPTPAPAPATSDCEFAKDEFGVSSEASKKGKNPQVILFKLIWKEDGRVVKYFALFTMVGILLAPLNFVFLSLDDLCKERGCNFSNLAGLVLVSQASCETLCFLIMPWILNYVSRSQALCFGFFILILRYFFYQGYYYTAGISPYWALVGEWGHGMSYSIFATIAADVALMFANQTRWFLPELRQLGYLSADPKTASKEAREAEETATKMALRATMQALISGLMDGIGLGAGSLIAGLVVEISGYIRLWQLMCVLAVCSLLIHQLLELTRCKWSDTYRPKQGTKAYEIMTLADTTKSDHHRRAEKTQEMGAAA